MAGIGRVPAMTRETFWDRVIEEPNTGCWVWLGHREKNGYGRVRINKKNILVHRWVFDTFVGPIPAGLTIDHLCRNRACANPKHLQAVTQQINILRGESRSAENSRKTHCLRGHALIEGNIRASKKNERSCLTCHRERERQRARHAMQMERPPLQ